MVSGALIYEDAGRRPVLSLEDPAAESERAQIQACARGDVAAFEALYHSHGGRLKSVARNLLGNAADAEDAVQEAFLKLYRSLSAFKGESRLSTFLHRILVNACFDIGRRRNRRVETQDMEERTRELPASGASDPALRLTLERGLRKLPHQQRAVFVLFEVEGLTHREVGEALGIPEGTSKHALFLAKKALQALVLDLRRGRSAS